VAESVNLLAVNHLLAPLFFPMSDKTEQETEQELEKELGRKPTTYDRLTKRDKGLLLFAFVVLVLVFVGLVVGIGF
jgi:hypothetical protein